MQILFSIFIVIICLLLGLIIMIQNPKGGGISQILGGQGSQMFGIQRTNDFLEKATWVLSLSLLLFIFLFNYILKTK